MLALIMLGLAICVGGRLCGRFYRFVPTAHRWATGTLVGLLLSTGFTYLAARHFAIARNRLFSGIILFFAPSAPFRITSPPNRGSLFIQPRVAGSEAWVWLTL